MISTLAGEEAQHFYRKNHYVDAGALLLPGEPPEIVFIKEIALNVSASCSLNSEGRE